MLLASACFPTMFQAVEIDGEPYWDGGYVGNPTITPLVRETMRRRHPGPDQPPGTPLNAAHRDDIFDRLGEISFNAPLMKEVRMIAL